MVRVSELEGIYVLIKINKIVHIDNQGIYCDNGLMVVPNDTRKNDSIRKKLHQVSKEMDFDITVENK